MIIMTNNLKEHIRKVLLEESLKQKFWEKWGIYYYEY